MCEYYAELNGMSTSVSLFVWLPGERAKWVEMGGQAGPREPRRVRAMSADLEKAKAEGWLAYGANSFPTTGDPRFSKPILTCAKPFRADRI